ncbi:hypothetical protein HanPSC8_Chr10g0408311 [Helianthus annuus]|nr:hypothetical protein HanPSC8_Chr10g0408311 [Helianthus annuus]
MCQTGHGWRLRTIAGKMFSGLPLIPVENSRADNVREIIEK